MLSTFDNIVGLPNLNRACVCCGAVARLRFVSSDKMPTFTKHTPLGTTFNNLCKHIVEQQHSLGDKETFLPLCIPCVHWLVQHSQQQAEIAFPIYYLQTFLRCLQTEDGLCFDRRTIWRLCKNLTSLYQDRVNYYFTFFDSSSQNVIQQIASSGTHKIAHEIAKSFDERHGQMMFAPSRKLSEFLRDSLVNKDSISERNTVR